MQVSKQNSNTVSRTATFWFNLAHEKYSKQKKKAEEGGEQNRRM